MLKVMLVLITDINTGSLRHVITVVTGLQSSEDKMRCCNVTGLQRGVYIISWGVRIISWGCEGNGTRV